MIRRLFVCDFDNTLFRSPTRPEWWPDLGWWSKPQSLSPPCVPEHPGPDWWVSSTVDAAKTAISDTETFAVLITGRLSSKFHARVFELLHQAGLRFDEVHLTPGGGGTLEFKIQIISGLTKVLGVEAVEIWEDRAEHLGPFKAAVEQFGITPEIHHVSTHSHPLDCTQESMAKKVMARFLATRELTTPRRDCMLRP